MNSKMTTNSELLTTKPKNKNKNELSNNYNRSRFTEIEIIWISVGRVRMGENVQEISNINGR